MQAFQLKIKLFLIISLLGLAACAGSGESAAETVTAVPTQAAVQELPTEDTEPVIAEPTKAEPEEPVSTETIQGGRSIGDPYAPELGNTGYDVQHYDIHMTLDPVDQYQVEGAVTIEATASENNLTQLSLDFIGFDINKLTVNEQTAVFNREDDKLIIDLPQPLTQDESFEIFISYSGEAEQNPSKYIGFASWVGLFYAEEDTIYILSEPDGSRYWFPNNDHPRDKATYRFEVTVPDGYTAVANGRLVDQQNNTFIWEHNFPMASYLATIAVGEYERVEDQSPAGVPLRHYVFPSRQTAFANSTDMTGEAIDWMGELFGVYPYEEYGYVTVHAPGVSLETQTMVLLSTGMMNERTVIHELAHMWFGDWVSLDSWGEMWRNEGFATYLSIMWEFRNDPDPEGIDVVMDGFRASLENDGALPSLNNPEPANLFSGYTYFGGAVMVHELRREMGDEAFFSGLQTYFQAYGGGVASDAQFIATMEEAAGKDLSDFFDEWLD